VNPGFLPGTPIDGFLPSPVSKTALLIGLSGKNFRENRKKPEKTRKSPNSPGREALSGFKSANNVRASPCLPMFAYTTARAALSAFWFDSNKTVEALRGSNSIACFKRTTGLTHNQHLL
jgi:hypothetical protein